MKPRPCFQGHSSYSKGKPFGIVLLAKDLPMHNSNPFIRSYD